MVDDLGFSASRFGVTRSGLVAALLQDVVPAVRQMAAVLPERSQDATGADLKRFRGVSAKVISEAIAKAMVEGTQNDLFAK
jgi:2-phospho-L-lactate guanylyltransferase (CobY/MobA/RfbA family)